MFCFKFIVIFVILCLFDKGLSIPFIVNSNPYMPLAKHITAFQEVDKVLHFPSCVGVIYSPKIILTSQHCVEEHLRNKQPPLALIGVINLYTSVNHRIDDIRMHKNYSSVAVLHLEKPIIEDNEMANRVPLVNTSALINEAKCHTVTFYLQVDDTKPFYVAVIQRKLEILPTNNCNTKRTDIICARRVYFCFEKLVKDHLSGSPLICNNVLYGIIPESLDEPCFMDYVTFENFGKGIFIDFRKTRDWLSAIEKEELQPNDIPVTEQANAENQTEKSLVEPTVNQLMSHESDEMEETTVTEVFEDTTIAEEETEETLADGIGYGNIFADIQETTSTEEIIDLTSNLWNQGSGKAQTGNDTVTPEKDICKENDIESLNSEICNNLTNNRHTSQKIHLKYTHQRLYAILFATTFCVFILLLLLILFYQNH